MEEFIIFPNNNRIQTTRQKIINVFGEFFSDYDDIKQDEFDDMILKAQNNGWLNWEKALKSWKINGKIG